MGNILENVSLKNYHTFSTHARAKWLTTFSSIEDCQHIIESDIWQENQKIVLGGGSNTLFTDDFPGIVLINKIPNIKIAKENDESVILTVGSGVNWNDLVNFCVEKNFYGLENLATADRWALLFRLA